MGDVYWIHRLKLNQGVTEEELEKGYLEHLMPMWIKLTGCKDVTLLKAVELPWSSDSRSEEYDYLWVTAWDKEEHRNFIERGGPRMPSMQPFWDKAEELNLVEGTGTLGAVEPVAK